MVIQVIKITRYPGVPNIGELVNKSQTTSIIHYDEEVEVENVNSVEEFKEAKRLFIKIKKEPELYLQIIKEQVTVELNEDTLKEFFREKIN